MDSGVETGNDSNDSSVVQHNSTLAMGAPENFEKPQSSNYDESIALMSNNSLIDNRGSMHSTYTQVILKCKESNFKMSQSKSSVNLVQALDSQPRISSMVIPSDKMIQTYPPKLIINFEDMFANSTSYLSNASPLSPHEYFSKMKSIKKCPEVIDIYVIRKQSRLRHYVILNNTECAQRFIKSGMSPNIVDQMGRTLLHLAASRGNNEMVKLLIEYGADPNRKDSIGNTPLHLAAVKCNFEIVKLLLRAGTDVLSKDQFGNNALDLARRRLRDLQNCSFECLNIKNDVVNVINILMESLKIKQAASDEQVEALSAICSRLTLSNTPDQVQNDVKTLLDNLDLLNLSK